MERSEIVSFLKTLCPTGKVEFSDLSISFSFDDALKLEKNIYFLCSVLDPTKRNGDKDVIFKNYFYVDFDLRKQCKDIDGNIISDDNIYDLLDIIKQKLSGGGYGDWKYIVFTGNGFHFYYVGEGSRYGVDEYKNAIEYYYNEIDNIFQDPLFKVDHACKNIGRVARLPGTMNYGRKTKFNLEPSECIIVETTESISSKIKNIPAVAILVNQKEDDVKQEREAIREIKQNMSRISGDDRVLEAILEVDIIPLVEEFTGLSIGKDNKNFPDEEGNTGMFTKDNLLLYMGTGRVDGKYKGYNTYLFVRENYNLSDNDTFEWFKNRYPHIKKLSDEAKKEYVKTVKKEEREKPQSNDIRIEKETIEWDFDGYKPTRGLEYIDKSLIKMDQGGELIVLFGPPGTGKTEFSFFVSRANKEGLNTVYFCLEIPEETILKRWALRKNGLSWNDIDYGNINQYQKDQCRKFISDFKIETKPYLRMLSINTQPTLQQLMDKMIEESKNNGRMLFIIDNLGKINGDENENIRFAEITKTLQTFAYNNKFWILLQHHTIKPQQKKEKGLDDVFDNGLFGPYGFRGSQKIYDDCTRLIEIHRDYNMNATKLLQYKHGPTDTRGFVELMFNKGEYEPYIEQIEEKTENPF